MGFGRRVRVRVFWRVGRRVRVVGVEPVAQPAGRRLRG